VDSPDQREQSVEAAAAKWMARRDRGLSAVEQDAYLEWLRHDPAHGVEIARLQRAWERLDTLQHWAPGHSSQPNPDLLAPARRRRWIWPAALATAAASIIGLAIWQTSSLQSGTRPGTVIHPAPQRQLLEDGSIVELNTGAKVDVNFTPSARNVRLVRGEAQFLVARNPARPFIVSADKVSVRAVGTAFDVHLDRGGTSVLVTEGKVQVDQVRTATSTARELSKLVAGQLGVVKPADPVSGESTMEVCEVTPAEIERALAWQTVRLEFNGLPLREVVTEFNRYNSRQLVIDDDATGAIVVGGTFRADNVEAFVRLLDVGFGVSATARGDEIVLRRR
jgi:transmembrane sensor